MTTAIAEPAVVPCSGELPEVDPPRVLRLEGVSWKLYRELRELPRNQTVRMTYIRGVLQLMSPSRGHERLSRRLGMIVMTWALEKGLPIEAGGSTLFQRDDLAFGVEPDECFYVERLPQIQPGAEANLETEPAPDLVIEVDVTSYSDRKLPVYAEMGVTEVWLWERGLKILVLDGKGYRQVVASAALPGFPVEAVARLLAEHNHSDVTALLVEIQKLARATS